MTPLANLRRVRYSYPGALVPALSEVDLVLARGLTAIAGPSAGGKSTLLRLFNGLVPHFHGGRISGQVQVLGLDALRTPTARLARNVGFVFQDPEAQFVRATVEQEVAFALENVGAPRPAMREAVAWAMSAVGVQHLAGRQIAGLSGGERQRVAVASGLALRPALLVLDEPTSQLDPQGAQSLWEVVAQLARDGVTVIASEHRVEYLLGYADQLGIVLEGRLTGPARAGALARELPDPPPIYELARRLGWEDIPGGPDEASVRTRLRKAPAPLHASPAMEPAWSLDNVVVEAGRTPILRQVSIAGYGGEVCAVMGPNGGGKTTLLRTIAGLQRPLAGKIWRHPGRVAYLPQDPGALLHRRSVEAEVTYTLRRSASNEPPRRMLEALGISHLAGQYPGDLSSGQRQRAALATLLAGRPALLLLDEPTRGMDRFARETLTDLLREMASEGAAIVIATHDPDLAAHVADRVLMVDEGMVRDAGAPRTALSGMHPFATAIGRLYPGVAVTVAEVLACL